MEQRCVAGIDVHKKMLAVVIRKPAGEVEYIKRKFGTTHSEICHLAAWLGGYQVSEVVMESTAQYWRPVWYGLEAHFALHLTHPLETRAPRGRKRDLRDAQRLADRWYSGDLVESFIPGAEQRGWRWLTRSRVQLKDKLGVIRNQVEGLLEEGGIKLAAVASDIFGVSGWAILQKIADGNRDIDEMVAECRGALRRKKAELREALAGALEPIYRILLKQLMGQVRLLWDQIEEINRTLAEQMKEHLAVLQRLMKMPGIDLSAAQDLLAEIGPKAAAFPSGEQFASWVGICPGCHESAEVVYSRRSAKGNRYLRRILCQIAWGAIHTKDTFFQGLFARLKPRIEAKGAAWAVAHRIGIVVWIVLHREVEYQERGPHIPSERTLLRKYRHLMTQCSRLGIDIKTLQGATA